MKFNENTSLNKTRTKNIILNAHHHRPWVLNAGERSTARARLVFREFSCRSITAWTILFFILNARLGYLSITAWLFWVVWGNYGSARPIGLHRGVFVKPRKHWVLEKTVKYMRASLCTKALDYLLYTKR